MQRLFYVCVAAALMVASPAAGGAKRPLPTYGVAIPPPQWESYCARYQPLCDAPATQPQLVALTTPLRLDLFSINQLVNKNMVKLSDNLHWHVADQWDDGSDGYGDCEDYALAKQQRLVAAGFAYSALRLTLVITPTGQDHAVLIVTAADADYVLDSLTDAILPWQMTGYRFLKWQSGSNRHMWESLVPLPTFSISDVLAQKAPKAF